MADGNWNEAELQQLWAEGIDVHRLSTKKLRQTIDASLRASMPARKHFRYPAPSRFASGSQMIDIRVSREHLLPGLERLWRGGLHSLGRPIALETPIVLDSVAHWRLNLLIGKASWLSSPEAVIRFWSTHWSLVQATSAEQQVLHLQANKSWPTQWHPHREESGAMRRAPIWGAIYVGMPQQAAVAAFCDARITYDGWGVWAPTVVAYATAEILRKRVTPAATLLDAIATVEPRENLSVQAISNAIHDAYSGTWHAWTHFIKTEFAGYPQNHSLPNLLLILGALHWHAEDWDRMQQALKEAGWDIPGNQLVAGALAGRDDNENSMTRSAVNELVESTLAAHVGRRELN